MVKINLKALNLKVEDSNKERERLDLKNGELLNLGVETNYRNASNISYKEFLSTQPHRLFCSYGDFFIIEDGLYYGVTYTETENGEIHPTGFNGKILTQEEIDDRKKN